jgi:hypothetical protein
MRGFRQHVAARLVACFLLTWAAADLLVPQLCSAETDEYAQGSGSVPAQDHDDCFCCCSHTEDPVPLVAMVTPRASVVRDTFRPARLTPGVPRSLYHPPLPA